MLLLSLLINSACSSVSQDLCVNSVKKQILSPDKAFKAVVFERNCRTSTNIQISVLPINQDLPNNETGNVFIYNTVYSEKESVDGNKANVEVKWIESKQIIVSFDDFTTTKVARMQQQANDVKVIYDKRPVILNQNPQ